jgi:hypothetical protein
MSEPRKTWGPFNGRHLTVIIVAIVAGVLAIPAGSWAAATGEKVLIKDSSTNALARVSSDGALKVSDGSGPMTVDGQVGITGPVTLGGPVAIAGPVDVTGTVTVESPIQLSQYFHTFLEIHNGVSLTYTPPSGQSLVVTSIQIAANVVNEPFAAGIVIPRFVTISVSDGSPGYEPIVSDSPSTIGTTVLPFEPGVLVPAGGSLKIDVSGTVTGIVFIFGYLVPGI